MNVNGINMIINLIKNRYKNLSNNKLIFLYQVLSYYLKDKNQVNYSLDKGILSINYEDSSVYFIIGDDFFYINFSKEDIDINYDSLYDELLLKKYNYIKEEDKIPADVFYCSVTEENIIINYYKENACNLFEISTDDNIDSIFDDKSSYDSKMTVDITESFEDILKRVSLLEKINKKHPIFYRDEDNNLLYIK